LFDFLSSDWFNIGLEIFFVLLISYDLKKYFQTRKREYISRAKGVSRKRYCNNIQYKEKAVKKSRIPSSSYFYNSRIRQKV